MRKLYYSLTIILCLFIYVSCSTESTPVYTLSTTASPTEAGTVSPSNGEYDEGEEVQVTASPNEHWIFDGWQGGHTGSTNPASITMNGDKDITAIFIKREYPLTVNTEGEGTVSEEVVQAKTTDYPYGTTVELTANPADGWELVEWKGDMEGNENPQQITVENERSVTAVFQEAVYTIESSIDGEGSISVTPEKDAYEFGEEVTITAQTTGDWSFVHWSGDLEGTENPIQFTMDSNIEFVAHFDDSPFEGGNGSELYPYQISTIDQLQEIRNYLDNHFEQINDINASETENWNGGEGFIPIGDDIIEFEGQFDGNDFTIHNLFIDRDSAEGVGLFGHLGEGAKVQNLTATNFIIKGENKVGGLVGINNGIIDNSHISGWISGSVLGIGGIVGNNYGSINNSSFDGEITEIIIEPRRSNYIGGIVGDNRGKVDNSYTNIKVDGTSGTIGGIAGTNHGEILDSNSIGSIKGRYQIGGIAGNNLGLILNSYSKTAVFGTENVIGGVSGTNSGTIEDSYSDNKVTGRIRVGGLVGNNFGEILNSEALADVHGRRTIGGLVGGNDGDGTIDNSTSKGQTTGDETAIGGLVGINTASISNSSAIGNVHGKQSRVGGLVGFNVGTIELSNSSGDVTGDEYVGGLTGMNTTQRNSSPTGDDFSGEVSKSFSTGEVNGNKFVGGLTGENTGIIEESYTSSIVNGTEVLGGLVGENNESFISTGSIVNSYSTSVITGEKTIGGLVGINRDNTTITNSFYGGSISGSEEIGGVAGVNGANLDENYWDSELSEISNAVGRGDSGDNTDLLTSEMTGSVAQENMSEFDWNDIWITTDGYPKLRWQID